MKRERTTDYADMSIKNGIARLDYKPLDLLDIAIAEIMVRDRVEFKDGVSYPTLFDIRNIKSTSKEARDYMADRGNELVEASALLTNSAVTKMIGNFFISVSKPKKPTRIFTDEEKSLEWLEQYLIKADLN